MRPLVGLSFILAVFALACGTKSASHSGANETPCTNDATAAAIRTSSSDALAAGPTGIAGFRVPDSEVECRLRPALLRVDDFPGWKDDRLALDDEHLRQSSRDEPFDSLSTCGAPANTFIGGLRAEFRRGDGDAALAEQIVAFAPGNAARFMQGVRRNCTLKLAEPPEDGAITKYAPAPATSLGDESLGVTLSLSTGGQPSDQPMPEEALFIRRGDVVAAVELIYPQASGTSIQAIAARVDHALATVRPMPEPTAVPGQGCLPPSTPTALAGANSLLQPALLQLDDLPWPWAPHLVAKCGRIDGEGACQRPAAAPQHVPTAVASTVFDSSNNSFLREDIEEWTGGGAAAELQRLRDRLNVPYQCDATFGSRHFKWEWAVVALPSLPDGGMALRLRTIGLANGSISGNGGSGEVIIYTVLLRQNDLIARLTYAPPNLPLISDFSGPGIDPQAEQILTEDLMPIVPIAQRKLAAVATQ